MQARSHEGKCRKVTDNEVDVPSTIGPENESPGDAYVDHQRSELRMRSPDENTRLDGSITSLGEELTEARSQRRPYMTVHPHSLALSMAQAALLDEHWEPRFQP